MRPAFLILLLALPGLLLPGPVVFCMADCADPESPCRGCGGPGDDHREGLPDGDTSCPHCVELHALHQVGVSLERPGGGFLEVGMPPAVTASLRPEFQSPPVTVPRRTPDPPPQIRSPVPLRI